MSSLIGYKIHTVHKKHVSLSENIGFNLVCVFWKRRNWIKSSARKKPGKMHLEDARHDRRKKNENYGKLRANEETKLKDKHTHIASHNEYCI